MQYFLAVLYFLYVSVLTCLYSFAVKSFRDLYPELPLLFVTVVSLDVRF